MQFQATEAELIAAAKSGNGAATQQLVEQYMPVIKSTARRYVGVLDKDDATQEALCAFLECLRDCDEENGPTLRTIVSNRLSEAVGNLAAGGEAFSIPPREYRRFLAVVKSADGDLNVAYEMCKANTSRHGMSPSRFLAILASSRGTESLDELADFSRGQANRDYTTSFFTPGASQGSYDIPAAPLAPANPMFRPTIPTEAEMADVRLAFSVVDDRERVICRHAYGFENDRAMSDAEIATVMPMTTERGRAWNQRSVHRKRNEGLDKMRAALLT